MSIDAWSWAALGAAVALPLVGGALVGAATRAETRGEWYRGLKQPAWTPPSAAFPIVWTALYCAMGVASWLVWRRLDEQPAAAQNALCLYALQLLVNFAWSLVFFGARSLVGGVVMIALLLALLVATLVAFWPVSRVAAWLLVPYLAWTLFAGSISVALLVAN